MKVFGRMRDSRSYFFDADTLAEYHIPFNHLFRRRGAVPKEKISKYQWSGSWRAKMNMYNVGSLLAVDYGGSGIFLKQSTRPRKHAVQGVFVGRPVVPGEVVGYYCG